MQEKQHKQPDKYRPHSLSHFILVLVYLLGTLFQQSQCSTNPVFLTTLPNIEAGSWVLTTTSPTTSSGFSYQNTIVNFVNIYSSVPNIGFGIDFINSNYQTSLTSQFLVDTSLVQKLQTYAMIQLNRTASSINQLSLNYIVCDSSFWLDVRQTLVDLSTTTAFTSASSLARTVITEVPYKTKSNSSNAQLTYNTIGVDMFRQNTHLFVFQITLAAKSLSSFNLSILIGGNNRLKWIRVCSYSYESIANSVDPPYYIDLGIVNSFSGNFPDSSGLAISSYGTIFTGMVDWLIDDTNSVLDYNMGGTGLSYTLATTSISQSRTSYFWYRKQSCPDYTFLSNHLCESCHYSCLTCISAAQTACITCPSTRTYISTNHTCACITNYVDVSVSLCVQLTCQPTCLTCANLDQCGTCDSSLGRSLKGIDCVCKDYTIDVYDTMGQKLCYPCHYTCQTCTAAFSETACLTCNLVKDHRFYRASNNTCACTDKYYPPASTSSPVCASCQYSCSKCTLGSACTQCNSTKGRVLNATTQFCSCMNQYYDDLLTQQCVSCPYRCLTCNSQGCLTCNSSLYRQLSSKQCGCMNSYYDDNVNALCQKCDYSCSTCNSLVECSSCNSSLQRYMDISTGKQLCLCAQRYYSVVGVEECMFCYTTCVTCSGPNEDNCLSCDLTKYREISIDKKCVCKAGYYQIMSTIELCSTCNYTCETCDNSATCLTCSATSFRLKNGANQCQCIDGYYDNGNQLCLGCDYRCLTCSSSATCLTCDSSTRNTTTLSNCICLNGYWDDGVSTSCKPCLPQCLTCLDGNGCASCPTNKVLTQTKNCVCMSRTYAPNCLPCNYNCQQCTNTAIQCTKCNGTASRYFNPTTKQCLCYDGYFDDGINELCAVCHYSCQTCSSYASCLTCPANRIKVGSLCSCIDQFYQNSLNKNCIACHYSCKTCHTFSQCTTCDNTEFRNFPVAGPTNLTLCECASGFYDNGISELCYKCEAKCLTCSAYSTCLSCNSTLQRYFVIGANDCKCLDSYYEDSITFLCMACHYSCKTCLNEDSCLTCLTGRYRPIGGGICLCNSGTFDNPTTKTCQTCSYPCVQCSGSATSCTSCDSTRNYISPPTSQCQCKIGTFQNGTACDSCLTTCSECTNKTACTVCKPGANRNLDGTNLCPCIYGYHDQSGTLLTCLKCHYSCVTCTNAASCTTCFSGRLPAVNSTCICPTQRYYDDGTNGACVPCAFNCLTCFSSSTNCTSCSAQSNRDLTGNQCLCKIGYFENNVQICVKCHYSCKTCSSPSACTTCDNSLKRVYTTGPYCLCDLGYFDDGINAQCQTCDYTCKQCTGISTQCTSCPMTRTLDATNKKCPCNQGLFDAGSPTCVSCLYNCKQCLNADQCTTCPTTRTLQSSTKQCLCNNGLYNVNSQQQCPVCDQLCLTCTDYNNCLTCDTANNFRYLLNANCVCPNGYYDNWIASANTDLVCRKCHYSCENCVSLTQCSSCSNLGQRIYNISTKLCTCKAGFYDDTVNMPCIACPFDCVTCSNSNTCLTCSAQRTLNPTTSRCDCAASFYQNGTTCELCPPQCLTCTNLTYCTACNGQRTLSTDNKCICAVGSFMVPNTALCTGCQYSCETCVSSLMCSTCNSTNKRFLSGSFCKCMTGFYDDNSSQPCILCQYSCKTCVEGGKCLSCDLTANRVLNLATNLCQCLSGYYQDVITKLCIKCDYTCVTCLSGSTCGSCNTLHYRLLNNSNSKCQCPLVGFYDDHTQSMCQTCDFKCLSCQTSGTTCTSCFNSSNRVLQVDKCNCKSGYFDNGGSTCSQCDYKCLTCQGIADNCTSCSSAALRTTTPTCACQVGFYDDGTSTLCKTCDYRCQSCSNAFTCDTCDTTKHRNLNPTTKMCDCMPVYYDQLNTTDCIPCTYSCVTCSHPTLCVTCPSTRAYKNGICECKIKYYEDFSSLQCPACDYSCKTCTNETQCSSCSVLMSRVFNSTTRKCSCVQGFYDTGLQEELCLKCQKSCNTCTNSTNCLSCPSNVNKTINLTISTYCTCLYGYYEDESAGVAIGQSSVCYSCHYSCQKCSGQSYACTQCEAAKHRYLNSYKQCLCEQSYYDDGMNEMCIKCTANCLACWGQGASQCLVCNNSTYILNNQCYTQCPDYYRNFATTTSIKTCSLCTPFCLKCASSQTICQQCQQTHRLFAFNSTHALCIDHCPQFYYEEPNTKQCLECQAPCYHCTNKYECTDCLSGYYLDTYCYKCHPYCFSCSGPTVFDCITCVNGYFLDNGLCRKLTCGQFQYVHSLNGCVNCSSTYPNSLTCDAQVIKTCQQNYMLQSTSLLSGGSSTVCKTCNQVSGYRINTLLNGNIECVQICGDGIVLNDQCDDGNTLNGDGCSEFCKIQKDWSCLNKKNCTLKSKPQLTITKVAKVEKTNAIELYLQLTVGLRLVKENFVLLFSGSKVTFNYMLSSLNTKYTQYKLLINYQTTVNQAKLNIKVVSPISQLTAISRHIDQSQSINNNPQRLLQDIQLSLPLSIQLSLQLQVQILTQPPATYVDPATRSVFSSWLVYVFLGYQVICLLLTLWLIYKRIKLMLIAIDLLASMRVIYVLCTFGMHNISDLLPSAAKGIQPFIYPFGPSIEDSYSPFYQAEYTKLIFSSCIIQLTILIICLAIKYLSSTRNSQNQGHYYLNSFMYCCCLDIYLSCICIFAETQFSTYIGSYSWALAILIFIALVMHNVMYITEGKCSLYKNRTVLPTKSFVTSQIQAKQKEINNHVLDGSDFNSSINEGKQHEMGQGQMWSQHHTQVMKSNKSDSNSSVQSYKQPKQSLLFFMNSSYSTYDLYDLAPSVDYSLSKSKAFYDTGSAFYQSSSRNKLSLYHLPILNNIMPLILVLVSTLISSGQNYLLIRSCLLLGVLFVALVFVLIQKPQTIKSSIRNIKLIFTYLVYIAICIILVISAVTKSQNNSQWIDLSILTIVLFSFVANIVFWVLNLKYSPQYKEYIIELRNQQIIERNQLAQQPRKKIYTAADDKSFNSSPIKNIFRKQPDKYKDSLEIKSHSVSQINSIQSENSHYQNKLNPNKNNSKTNVQNVFDDDQSQQPNQINQERYQSNFLQQITHNQPNNQAKIKAITEYDAYLTGYGTFGINKEQRTSQKIIIANPQIKASQNKTLPKQSQNHIQAMEISEQKPQIQNNNIKQGNDAIKKSIKLDNNSFIQKNKRVSPKKVSTIAKIQRKDDSLNHNSLILDNDLTVVIEDPKPKLNKRIQGNTDQKLLTLIHSDKQGDMNVDATQKHYMYKNPPPKSTLSKSKSKSKGKSSGSLHSNKSLPKKLKKLNSHTSNIDQKIIMLEQSNNNHIHSEVSDYLDNQTNQPNDSRSKELSKLTDYTMLMRNKHLKKELYESDQSLDVQKQKTDEVKSSFSQRYHQLNQKVLKHPHDGLSSGLSDQLSEQDYSLDFPTGINQRQKYQGKKGKVYDETMIQSSRPKKVKKHQPQARVSPSKQSSRQKRPSLSPSKLSSYPRPQLQDISSIHEQEPNDIYTQGSELGIQQELNVYNKILKDHQKYKDKKVDKKFIEKELKKKNNENSVDYENEEK